MQVVPKIIGQGETPEGDLVNIIEYPWDNYKLNDEDYVKNFLDANPGHWGHQQPQLVRPIHWMRCIIPMQVTVEHGVNKSLIKWRFGHNGEVIKGQFTYVVVGRGGGLFNRTTSQQLWEGMWKKILGKLNIRNEVEVAVDELW